MTTTWTSTLWLNDIETEDHDDLGIRFLLWQYRINKPRLHGFLSAFLTQVQNLDDVTFQLITGIWPLTAVGVQLDLLGKIVGEPRGTLTDSEYRVVILARILANKSKGKLDEIIEIIEVAGATGTIQIADSYPAGVVINVAGMEFGDVLGPIVASAMPGGVYLYFAYSQHDDDDCFAASNTLGADEINANGGYGDLGGVTQTSGGYMTGGSVL